MDIVIEDFFEAYEKKRERTRQICKLFYKIDWHHIFWIKNPKAKKLSFSSFKTYYDFLLPVFIEFIIHYDLVVNEDAARLFQVDFLGWNADEVTI